VSAAGVAGDDIQTLGPWFHNLHLPDGRQTAPDHPLGDFPAWAWREIRAAVPDDLSGWRALDVGCNAGYYSFELARRGAHVTAIDFDARYLRQARWAAAQLGLCHNVAFRSLHVYELAREPARYDLVWFMGVAYHLRHPLLALDLLRRLTRRLLVFQSMTFPAADAGALPADLRLDERSRLAAPDWPKMAFIERSLAGDSTNWWVPTSSCLEAMLRSSGFCIVSRPARETYVCEPATVDAKIARDLEAVFGGIVGGGSG
jgi:tRNA (mo5U34)-methyltransferase